MQAWYLWMQNDTIATGILSFGMHEIVYFGRSLPWIIIGCIPYFDKWKIQGVCGPPPHQVGCKCFANCYLRRQSKIPTWKEQAYCAGIVLLMHVTVELPQIWLFHPMAAYCGLEYGVPFPPWWKIAFQVCAFFVMEDTWHYFFHRALHYGPLYRAIHKMHHFYSAPFGLAAEYASPIEIMLLGLGTIGSPTLWVYLTGDLHLVTVYLWIVARLFQAIDAHSGYDFPWSLRHILPFWGGADFHDLHHEKFIGNYASSFRWWDKLLDTEATPEAQLRRRARKIAAAKAKKQ
jgi:methylsterol monooxygenase